MTRCLRCGSKKLEETPTSREGWECASCGMVWFMEMGYGKVWGQRMEYRLEEGDFVVVPLGTLCVVEDRR